MTRRWNRAMAPWLVVAVIGFAAMMLFMTLRPATAGDRGLSGAKA